ncbi:MAG TPA: hypothetical protein VEF33_09275 [Syntrophales bacterium]|nr:hypothetical protein [Syntrophales bacterium]
MRSSIRKKIERIRDHDHKKNASLVASGYRRVAVEEHPVVSVIRKRKLWLSWHQTGPSTNRSWC